MIKADLKNIGSALGIISITWPDQPLGQSQPGVRALRVSVKMVCETTSGI